MPSEARKRPKQICLVWSRAPRRASRMPRAPISRGRVRAPHVDSSFTRVIITVEGRLSLHDG